jgi:hypothetical protein
MAAIDRPRSHDVMALGRERGRARPGSVTGEPQDAAALAAHVIGDEVLSIFLAVDEATTEIEDDARRDADEIVRAASDAAAPALSRLEALSGQLQALSADLDRRAEERARRGSNGAQRPPRSAQS